MVKKSVLSGDELAMEKAIVQEHAAQLKGDKTNNYYLKKEKSAAAEREAQDAAYAIALVADTIAAGKAKTATDSPKGAASSATSTAADPARGRWARRRE